MLNQAALLETYEEEAPVREEPKLVLVKPRNAEMGFVKTPRQP